MAIILHLDTSGPAGIAMLAKDGKPQVFRLSEGEREHAGNINGMVTAVLEEAGLSWNKIDAVAVCNGPGSYTGLRIGLATAKGYCYVHDLPLILHSRLILMLREAAASMPDRKNLAAIMPARTGEYYAAFSGEPFPAGAAHLTTHEIIQMFKLVEGGLGVLGRVGEDLLSIFSFEDIYYAEHHILDRMSWAAASAEAFSSGSFADIAYSEPEYLKPAFVTKSRDRSRF